METTFLKQYLLFFLTIYIFFPVTAQTDSVFLVTESTILEKRHEFVYSPDGQKALSYQNGQKKVYYWDVTSGHLLKTLEIPEGVLSLDFSKNGTSFFISNYSPHISIYDYKSGQVYPNRKSS